MKKLLLLSSVVLSAGLSAQADQIADWTFETSQPAHAAVSGAFGAIAPELGAGTASAFHVAAATYSTPQGNGSAHSFSSTQWAVNDYYQFLFSTVGLTDIQLSFDQGGSASGPGHFQVQYSTDGTHFSTAVADYTLPSTTAFTSGTTPNSIFTFTEDLSSFAIDNSPTVYIRLVDDAATSTSSVSGGSVGTTGTDRVDNFIVTGSELVLTADAPDHAYTMGLLSLTVVGLGVSRRKVKQ